MPQVSIFDPTHELEHSLEVHLPFLQELLDAFSVVPLVVGEVKPESVAEVLEALWGGPETLIVVSSDLSHYLDYDRAREIDRETCRAIENLDPAGIARERRRVRDACTPVIPRSHRAGQVGEGAFRQRPPVHRRPRGDDHDREHDEHSDDPEGDESTETAAGGPADPRRGGAVRPDHARGAAGRARDAEAFRDRSVDRARRRTA